MTPESSTNDIGIIWQLPKSTISLPRGEVHIWRAEIPPPGADSPWPGLPADDAEWCMHFRAPQRRQQAFAGRALLWHALTKYAPEKAAAMTLRQRAGSKPTLFENSGPAGIQFSLAHSASMVLCAFSRTAALGVDIERIRPRPHLHKIAARMFTKHEQAAIEKLPFAEQTAAFFRCWNSKEAYLKASGALNLFQLSNVETISVASARNPWQHSYGEGESPHTWSFYSFEPWPGFSAACAVEGVPSAWRFWIATL